jgi:autotransporter-associated beta strand protein
VFNLASAATVGVGGTDTLTLGGIITNSGALTKTGAATLTLGGVNTYSGSTTVFDGTLLVDGSIASSACTVNSGATLGGTGTVGTVIMASGATNAPGHNGVGTLNSGAVELQAGSTLAMQINSDTDAADKLASSGAVTIGSGVALSLSDLGTTYLGGGKAYTLVSRNSGNVTEEFAGYPEGYKFLLGQNYFTITYKGGTSVHDVVITNVKYEGSVYTIR